MRLEFKIPEDVLDAERLNEVRVRGFTRLPSFVDARGVAAMQEAVWSFLHTRGVHQGGGAEWPSEIDRLQQLRKTRAFDPFLTPELDQICDQLVGVGSWTDLGSRPQALISLPEPGPWVIPHKSWHFDLPPKGPIAPWGAVRFLGLVDRIDPDGGGTLLVEGSHRLVQRMVDASPDNDAGQGADARRALNRHEWFAALSTVGSPKERLVEGATIDDVDVRVVEVTGGAGDLIVMHPWLMHNISMNCSGRPRMMMSYTCYATAPSPR